VARGPLALDDYLGGEVHIRLTVELTDEASAPRPAAM
jgi:hypothetical protein